MTGALGAFATELTPEHKEKVEQLKTEIRPFIKVRAAARSVLREGFGHRRGPHDHPLGGGVRGVGGPGTAPHRRQAMRSVHTRPPGPSMQTAADLAFCNQGTYVRYLAARHWHVHKAARMLEASLAW